MKSSIRFATFLFLFLLLLAIANPTHAQTSGISLSAAAGYDGFYSRQAWTPVFVTVANNGPAIEGEIRITLGSVAAGNQLIYNAPLSLPTQSNKRLTLYVSIDSIVTSLAVELLDENQSPLAETRTNSLDSLDADDLFYGVVSSDPAEFSLLENVTGSRRQAAVGFLDIADLPEVAAAWNTLHVLIFDDVDTGQLTADQQQALRGWVNTGGQLVITGGAGWQKTAVSFTDLLPVTITGSQSVPDLPTLSTYASLPFRDPGPYLVATSSLKSGELLLHQDGLPLLARQPLGRGSVYFLALDPKAAPLVDWDGSEQVWAEVAIRAPILPSWATGAKNSYAAGSAVASFPSLALPSTASLVLFLVVYIVAVGPANYLVLKRLNRRELAWITIPAIILVFSTATYLTGFQLKGNTTIINQMSIAFGQAGAEQLRVQTLFGIYSPRRTTYDLILPATVAARPFNRDAGTLSGNNGADAVSRGNELIISGVVVDVGDTGTFVAESYQPAPNITGRAVLSLNNSSTQVEITIQNNSDITLEQATLLIGFTAIPLQTLTPGESTTQTHILGLTGLSTTSSGVPSYTYTTGSGSTPLMTHADTILGTSDYYNDREAYPRWQLLQAMEDNSYGSTGASFVLPENVVTLVGWSEVAQVETAVNRDEYTSTSTTLYLLEIPITQNIVSGSNISVPVSMLNWQVLNNSGVYQPSIQNLYLYGNSWIEFEFTPWADFQNLQANNLSLLIADPGYGGSLPQVELWNWQTEEWVELDNPQWGNNEVSEFAPYIGPGSAIRLRLEVTNVNTSVTIQEIYPILTGDLQ